MDAVKQSLYAHYKESLEYFDKRNIVGLFLQGSQNYGLTYENSDVDTKLIVLPNFNEIAFNKKPVSTTHIRENEEHIDFKDIRLYMQTFRKQNLNFLEILFTPYKIVNPDYAPYWDVLINHREDIAHYNLYRAVKSMKGIALEKYHALQHEYPSKVDVLAQWGYDPKQLHHLLRVEECLMRYIEGEPYEDCLQPRDKEYLISVKRGLYNVDEAVAKADKTLKHIFEKADAFCESHPDEYNKKTDELLDFVQYQIMKKCGSEELKNA